jgi:hypothetical protein
MRVPASIGRLCYVVITIEQDGSQMLETCHGHRRSRQR